MGLGRPNRSGVASSPWEKSDVVATQISSDRGPPGHVVFQAELARCDRQGLVGKDGVCAHLLRGTAPMGMNRDPDCG